MATKPVQSIYELADSLGVSASTVSRVLNQRRGIGKATRQRVLALARAAGFRPRMTARQRTVAVVIDHHQFSSYGSFVANVLTSMVEALSKHDLAVELLTEHNHERLTNRLMDGVLAMAWNDDTIKILKRVKDAPVVTLNRMDVPGFSAVVTDHFQHGQMAVEYLAGRGHKRIAMIGREGENWGAVQRIEGFTSKMHELGLAVDSSSICFTKHQPMYGVLHRLIRQSKPTAIFVADEGLGLEATYILQNMLKLRVPEDVSLLGMESAQVSQYLSPPMTTLAQPLAELAEKSLELLLQQMDNAQEPQYVVLESRLIERESVAKISNE